MAGARAETGSDAGMTAVVGVVRPRGRFIDGFGLSGYRSFGSRVQRMGPFEKINLFIGPNNSGKSNIVRFLSEHYTAAVTSAKARERRVEFTDLDRHIGDSSGRYAVEFGLKPGGRTYEDVLERHAGRVRRESEAERFIRQVLASEALTDGGEVAWFRYEGAWGAELALSLDAAVRGVLAEQVLGADKWRRLWSHLTNDSGGELEKQWIPQTLRASRSRARSQP